MVVLGTGASAPGNGAVDEHGTQLHQLADTEKKGSQVLDQREEAKEGAGH